MPERRFTPFVRASWGIQACWVARTLDPRSGSTDPLEKKQPPPLGNPRRGHSSMIGENIKRTLQTFWVRLTAEAELPLEDMAHAELALPEARGQQPAAIGRSLHGLA
jgi:hypothetical protein